MCGSGEVVFGDLVKNEVTQVVQARGQGTRLACCRCFRRQVQRDVRAVYQTYNKNQTLDERIVVGGVGVLLVLKGSAQGVWETALDQRFDWAVGSVDLDRQDRILYEAGTGALNLLAPNNGYSPVTLQHSHAAPVTAARFLGDRLVVLACMDGTLRVLDLADFMPALLIDTA